MQETAIPLDTYFRVYIVIITDRFYSTYCTV